jgi:hypothetical protein
MNVYEKYERYNICQMEYNELNECLKDKSSDVHIYTSI